jgi:RNA polymerase sigma-70 factor (ECF subfamily)
MAERVISLSRPAALDADTFAGLYLGQAEAILNYCLFRVGDRAVAEDLTADAFERAWKARRRYRPDQAGFSTWLFAITRRVVTDWQRRSRRRPMVSLDGSERDSAPLLESQMMESEQLTSLRTLVLNMPVREREIIALKYGAGMNNGEIGRLLGKSETAIGSALHRAVQRLRVQWKELDRGSDV